MKPSHKSIVLNNKGRTLIYNRGNALKNWDSKLANLKAGNNDILDIAVIGDSISEGFQNNVNLATLKANGFKWKLSTYFNALYDDVGEGFIPGYYPSAGAGPTPVTYTGTWVTSNYNFAGVSKRSNVAGDKISFSFTGTGCEIWTYQASTMSDIDVSIDGGANTTFTIATSPTTYPKRVTIANGLENTTHTVVITLKSNAYFHFSGFMELKGTRGVRVHMCAKSGSGIGSFTNNISVLPAYTDLAPDLAIINIGTNDYMTNTVPATFKTNLQTLITHLKGIGTDVIIGTDGTNDRTGFTYEWQNYLDAMKEVALSNNCCFVDTDSRWGSKYNARSNGYLPVANPTDIHPTILGHNDAFETYKMIIDPS